MKKIGENIWVHDDSMSLAGTQLRLRMTIVKLANGGLWIHSPTALSPELMQETEGLGSVSFIVGASNGHNIWLREWQDAFPDAVLYVSGGIPKKLKLTNYQVLDESHENIWEVDLAREYMLGVPFFNESVFLHKKTKSLIITDLIQNYSDERPSGLPGFVTKYIFEPYPVIAVSKLRMGIDLFQSYATLQRPLLAVSCLSLLLPERPLSV